MPPFMQYLSGHDVAMIEINGWTQVISNNILLILSETFSENEHGAKQRNKSYTIENEHGAMQMNKSHNWKWTWRNTNEQMEHDINGSERMIKQLWEHKVWNVYFIFFIFFYFYFFYFFLIFFTFFELRKYSK